ncbi:MAG: hypothetical protein ABFC96_12290 [Thermoguttaceae bacterium]
MSREIDRLGKKRPLGGSRERVPLPFPLFFLYVFLRGLARFIEICRFGETIAHASLLALRLKKAESAPLKSDRDFAFL